MVRGWRWADRRIRVKLALILLLPLLAIIVLAALRVASTVTVASRAERTHQLVVLGSHAGTLVAALQVERAAAGLVFDPADAATRTERYRRAVESTDALVGRLRGQARRVGASGTTGLLLDRLDGELAGLPLLRQQVLNAPDVVVSAATFRYRAVIADLLELRAGVTQTGLASDTSDRVRAEVALSRATEALGLMQSAVIRVLTAGRLSPAAQVEIISADTGFAEAVSDFRSLAPAGWTVRLDAVAAGANVAAAERLRGIVTRTQPGQLPKLGCDVAGWSATIGEQMRLLHAAEADFDNRLADEVLAQRDTSRRTSALEAGGVISAIGLMVAVSWAVARSLVRSLSGLRLAAEDVAGTRLPTLVSRFDDVRIDLSRTGHIVADATTPVPVDGGDEVGQVAVAFNAVVAEAVRLAGEQAALRAGIRAMFNAVARRGQRRIDAVLSSIDQLQRDEADPARLELLFRLDLAATGLRRLTAGLQVLAGGRAGLPRQRAAPLPDVLRAAQAEIDQYRQVEFGVVDSDVRVHGEVAEELIHLLAELLDNAARFSPPDTAVLIDARRVGDQVHVQIRDTGKGMTDAQLAEAHERLTNPDRLDYRAAERMGLAVVAAIARQLRVGVDLRRAPTGAGIHVDLTIPHHLFTVAPPPTNSPDSPDPAASVPATQTARLPLVAAPVPVAAEGPPPWPPPATPTPEPVIFQQLEHDWFGDTEVADQWQAAAAAAATPATDLTVTAAGLPQRRSGEHVIPPLPAATAASHPAAVSRRDVEALRRRFTGVERGLVAAGRRPVRRSEEHL